MHFDSHAVQAHMPRHLAALLEKAQGTDESTGPGSSEGLARRTFLKV